MAAKEQSSEDRPTTIIDRVFGMTVQAVIQLGLSVVLAVAFAACGIYFIWWLATEVDSTLNRLETRADAEWAMVREMRKVYSEQFNRMEGSMQKWREESRQHVERIESAIRRGSCSGGPQD